MLYMLLALLLMQVKHFVIDFPGQTPSMLVQKGVYLKPWGLLHSLLHGIGTSVVIGLFMPSMMWLGMVDAVVHYHIDYVKTRFGEKDISKSLFWTQLGADQLLHQLTYVAILGWVFTRAV